MTESPDQEFKPRRCWWKLSEWGFSRFERRAIALLTFFILTGAGLRFYHNSQVSQQLTVWSVNSKDSVLTESHANLQKFNINTARKDELIMLPGIGPVRADAIISYRNAHGDFKSSDDLLSITGIGEKTVAKISPYLLFNSEPDQ